jgi:hypothetical protein
MSAISSKAEPGPATGSLLVGAKGPRAAAPARPLPTHRGWSAVGWFGLLLTVIGFADLSLHLIRPAFGTPEWEFATMSSMLASLPLPTIGLAAVVGALLVNRARVPSMVAAGALLLLALLILLAYTIFMLHLPLALQAVDGPQGAAIYRTIARATIMGGGFGLAYLIAGIVLLRHLPQRSAA